MLSRFEKIALSSVTVVACSAALLVAALTDDFEGTAGAEMAGSESRAMPLDNPVDAMEVHHAASADDATSAAAD